MERVYVAGEVLDLSGLPRAMVMRYGRLLHGIQERGGGRTPWTGATIRQMMAMHALRADEDQVSARIPVAATTSKLSGPVLLHWTEPVRDPAVAHLLIIPYRNESRGFADADVLAMVMRDELQQGQVLRVVNIPESLREL